MSSCPEKKRGRHRHSSPPQSGQQTGAQSRGGGGHLVARFMMDAIFFSLCELHEPRLPSPLPAVEPTLKQTALDSEWIGRRRGCKCSHAIAGWKFEARETSRRPPFQPRRSRSHSAAESTHPGALNCLQSEWDRQTGMRCRMRRNRRQRSCRDDQRGISRRRRKVDGNNGSEQRASTQKPSLPEGSDLLPPTPGKRESNRSGWELCQSGAEGGGGTGTLTSV